MDLSNLLTPLVYEELIRATIILLAPVVIGLVVRTFIKKYARRFTQFTSTTIDDELLSAVKKPAYIAVVLGGLYLAVMSVSVSTPYATDISRVFKIPFPQREILIKQGGGLR